MKFQQWLTMLCTCHHNEKKEFFVHGVTRPFFHPWCLICAVLSEFSNWQTRHFSKPMRLLLCIPLLTFPNQQHGILEPQIAQLFWLISIWSSAMSKFEWDLDFLCFSIFSVHGNVTLLVMVVPLWWHETVILLGASAFPPIFMTEQPAHITTALFLIFAPKICEKQKKQGNKMSWKAKENVHQHVSNFVSEFSKTCTHLPAF